MADDPRYVAYLMELTDLKLLWGGVERWMNAANGKGPVGKFSHPHQRRSAQTLAEKCLARYDIAVERLIEKCHSADFPVAWRITGPEEILIKKKRPPPRRMAA